MLNNDFVENFIESCIDKGIKKEKDICDLVLKEIQENEEKIRESNKLRVQNKNLRLVLKELGHESTKKLISNEKNNIFENANDIENSAYTALMISICSFVESNINNKVTARDLINNLSSIDSEKEIYMCLKNLYDVGILTRSGNDRNIVFGQNWENRKTL